MCGGKLCHTEQTMLNVKHGGRIMLFRRIGNQLAVSILVWSCLKTTTDGGAGVKPFLPGQHT